MEDYSELGGVYEEDYSALGGITEEQYLAQQQAAQNAPQNNPSFMDKLTQFLAPTLNRGADLGKEVLDYNLNTALGAGDALVNLPKQVGNMVAPALQPLLGNAFAANLELPLSQSSSGTGYEMGKLGGEILGFAGGGVPLNAARGAATSLPLIGKLAEALGGAGMGGVARRGIGSALYGATQNPEDVLGGAGVGGATSVITDALLGPLSKFAPRNLFRGKLTPEELLENLDVTKGTATPLGDVLESPSLKKFYENRLTNTYGSGIDNVTAQLSHNIVNKGENILDKYRGDIAPSEVTKVVGEILKKGHLEHGILKEEFYVPANKIADEAGFILKMPKFSNVVNENLKLLENQEFLKWDQPTKDLISKLRNYQDALAGATARDPATGAIVTKSINPKDYVSLKEMNFLSRRLKEQAKRYGASPTMDDRFLSKVLLNMGNSLKSDINEGIKEFGNKELSSAWRAAEDNYARNYSPFLDKEVFKFLGGGEDPEKLIMNFIKTGPIHDQANKIHKLMKVLPPEGQDLVRYSYLSRAIEGPENARSVNPHKLRTNWNDTKLGQNQKKALFPNPADRKELDQYTKLVNMNPNALNRMFNPYTGQRNSDVGMLVGSASAGATLGGGVGASLGGALGAIPGGVAGAVLGPVTMGVGAKYLASKLHSPSYREELVKRMIENSGNPVGGHMKDALKTALIQLFGS